MSSCTRLAEAALSLQAAGGQFLLEGNYCTKRPKNVLLKSSCEIDKECQLVLKNTFGHCNYPDVTCVDFGKNKGSFCTTHQRRCPQARDDPTRTWLRSCNLTWENWCLESCPDYLIFLDCRLPDRWPTCQKVCQDCLTYDSCDEFLVPTPRSQGLRVNVAGQSLSHVGQQ